MQDDLKHTTPEEEPPLTSSMEDNIAAHHYLKHRARMLGLMATKSHVVYFVIIRTFDGEAKNEGVKDLPISPNERNPRGVFILILIPNALEMFQSAAELHRP